MIRFLADEDFNNDLLRALRRRRPAVDAVRVQDVGLSGQPDPAVLAWAALGLAGLAVMGGLRITYRRQATRVHPLRRYELADLAERRR